MFGYLVADPKALPPEQRSRYEGCYCGLCRSIGQRCGQLCRCALAYDMAFLTLTLHSLYEPPERQVLRPCPIHPFRKRASWQSDASDYAADLNVMLALLKAEDDWLDERRPVKMLEAGLLRRAAAEAAERAPRQWEAMQDCMARLREIERRRDPSPDAGANAFGDLMAALFVWKDDRWESTLRRMGRSLGQFIYLLDAVIDRPQDEKRGLYNPVLGLTAQGATDADLRGILLMLMADCTEAWESLPLVTDAELGRRILYSGVWSRLPVITGEEK